MILQRKKNFAFVFNTKLKQIPNFGKLYVYTKDRYRNKNAGGGANKNNSQEQIKCILEVRK